MSTAEPNSIAATPPRPRTLRLASVFVAIFVLSRLLLAASGVEFCGEHVAQIMHFPDLELLRDHLLETVWYMHGQPPGPSLVLGALLKLGGPHWATCLAALFHALAAAAGLAMLLLLSRLGARPWLALGVATGFVSLPSIVVYEHYAFTTLPVTALLVIACVPLPAAGAGRAAAAGTFLLVLALVLNVRNVFHLVWWGACFLLLFRAWSGPRRPLLLAAILPLLVAIGPYAKNAVVHGRFEASSWLGFGLARKTYHGDDLARRQEQARSGKRAPIEAVPVFGSVEEFALVVPSTPPTGVRVLDRPRKASGAVNYHHAVVAHAAARMRDAALAHIATFPARYVQNVAATARQFFAASSTWAPAATPRSQLGDFAGVVDGILHAPILGVANVWLLLTLAVLLSAVPSVWRVVRRGPPVEAVDLLVTFAAGTFVYVAVTAILLDAVEVMRHRLKVDGLLWLAGAVLWLVPRRPGDVPAAPSTTSSAPDRALRAS